MNAARSYLSSFEGLLSMYQGKVHVVACHLHDGERSNASFVRSLMPGTPAALVNLSCRSQGFYVRSGNPKRIRSWEDLRRSDIPILNRRPGSSARILLDVHLKKLGIPAAQVKGYDRVMKSHLTMAAAVAAGEADLAIGTERVSRQMEGIDFVELLQERFDLVIRRDMMDCGAIQTMLRILNSDAFRREIAHLSGNDYRDLGRIIEEV